MFRSTIGIALFLFQGFAALALDIPKLQDRVTDLARVLTSDQIAGLDSKLQELEKTDSTQVAVLIIPSLEGEPLEDYSMHVAEAWRLGQKGRDNGALLLISLKDRRIRIEVGYGLEATLTDARSNQIIRGQIAPRFRAGDYYGGIDAGVTGIIQTIRGDYQAAPDSRMRGESRGLFNFIILMLFPLFWILSATGKWGGGILGALVGILLPYSLIGHSLLMLLGGGLVGGLLGTFMGALVRAGSQSCRGPRGFVGPFFWGGGGGFGGGGFSGGGFSGGGGSFGGGGSSGGW